MGFPSATRSEYEKTSLVEVICQIKFPPILKIETEVDAFQDRVRSRFPGYDRRNIEFSVPIVVGDQSHVASDSRKEHVFLTTDGDTKIALGREFIAYATHKYPGWSAFKDGANLAAQTTNEVYVPAPALRVGLRYQNLLRRSSLGLSDVPWRDLLAPELLGFMGNEKFALTRAFHEEVFAIKLNGRPAVGRAFHGLVHQDEEECYLLDNDFFIEGTTEWTSIGAILDDMHQQSWDCFRYFIKDRLHESMNPRA